MSGFVMLAVGFFAVCVSGITYNEIRSHSSWAEWWEHVKKDCREYDPETDASGPSLT